MPFYLQLIIAFLLGMLFTCAYILFVTRRR